jgi:hypothetical protein
MRWGRCPGQGIEELGNKMAAKIEQYRGSALHKLRTKGRAALVRAL